MTHSAPKSIACMEVWGGSQTFDSAVSVPGNNVQVYCRPFQNGASGGDMYYVSNCAAGLITRFVLADVSGHGETVASVANELRRIMRKHINTADQTRFAVDLNEAFAALELHGRFATAVLATYFAPTDHLIVCNAGHPRPLLFRSRVGVWELLDARTPGVIAARHGASDPVGIANLPLGVVSPTDYEQFAMHLDPNDLVVLYTDAWVEASNEHGVELGEVGLLKMIRSVPPTEYDQLPAVLHERIAAYSGRRDFGDDATLVVLQHTAEDPPHLSALGQVTRIGHLLGFGKLLDTGPAGNV